MLNCAWFPLNPLQALGFIESAAFIISRWQEQECPWGCGTSLGLGAGKPPAASMPTWWHACHACSLLLPTQSTAGWAPASPGFLEAQRTGWCQGRRAFPVMRGGGGSWLQWGGVCWRLHGKGCPWSQLWLCTQQVSWLGTGVSESGQMTQSTVQFLPDAEMCGLETTLDTLEKLWPLSVSCHTHKGGCASPGLSSFRTHLWLGNVILTS